LRGHFDHVCTILAWDNYLVSGSADHTARVWDSEGKCLKVLKGHLAKVCGLVCWGDELTTASSDAFIFLWSKELTKKLHLNLIRKWRDKDICLIVWDNQRLVTCSGNNINVWAKDGSCVNIRTEDYTTVSNLIIWNNLLVSLAQKTFLDSKPCEAQVWTKSKL